MKFNRTIVVSILLGLWLMSFIFCLYAVVRNWNDVPNLRESFLKQTIETFLPGLTVMLALAFSGHQASKANPQATGKYVGALPGALAIVIALLYVGTFDTFVVRWLNDQMDIRGVIESFGTVRPYTNWLVLPVLAYFFGKPPRKGT